MRIEPKPRDVTTQDTTDHTIATFGCVKELTDWHWMSLPRRFSNCKFLTYAYLTRYDIFNQTGLKFCIYKVKKIYWSV